MKVIFLPVGVEDESTRNRKGEKVRSIRKDIPRENCQDKAVKENDIHQDLTVCGMYVPKSMTDAWGCNKKGSSDGKLWASDLNAFVETNDVFHILHLQGSAKAKAIAD
jgi:hypothetical protein